LDDSFRRLRSLQDNIKFRWQGLKADPNNPELQRQHRALEAEWGTAFSEYVIAFKEWSKDQRPKPSLSKTIAMTPPRKPVEVYRGVKIYESHAYFECTRQGLKAQTLCDARLFGVQLSGTLPEVKQQVDGMLYRSIRNGDGDRPDAIVLFKEEKQSKPV
jgi:hypothetical protein